MEGKPGRGKSHWSKQSFLGEFEGTEVNGTLATRRQISVWMLALLPISIAVVFVAFSAVNREQLPYDDAILFMQFFDQWKSDSGTFGWLQYIEGETGNVWPFAILAALQALGLKSYATFLAAAQTFLVVGVLLVMLIAHRMFRRWPYVALAGAITVFAPGQVEALTWAVPIQHTISIVVLLVLILSLLNLQSHALATRQWWTWWSILLLSSSMVWTLREPVVAGVAVLFVVVLVESLASPQKREPALVLLPLAGGMALTAIGLAGRFGSQLSPLVLSVCDDLADCWLGSAVPFTSLLMLTACWIAFAVVTAMVVIRGRVGDHGSCVTLTALRYKEYWRAITMVLILASSMYFASSALMVATSVPVPIAELALEVRWITSTAPLIVLVAVATSCLLLVWKSKSPIFWLLVAAMWAFGSVYLSSLSEKLPLWGGGVEEIQGPLIIARYSAYVVPLFALALAGNVWSPSPRFNRDTAIAVLAVGLMVVGGANSWMSFVERRAAVAPVTSFQTVYSFNPKAERIYVVCPTPLTEEFLNQVNDDFGKRQGWAPLTAEDILALEGDQSPAIDALLNRAQPIGGSTLSDFEIAERLCVRLRKDDLP